MQVPLHPWRTAARVCGPGLGVGRGPTLGRVIGGRAFAWCTADSPSHPRVPWQLDEVGASGVSEGWVTRAEGHVGYPCSWSHGCHHCWLRMGDTGLLTILQSCCF